MAKVKFCQIVSLVQILQVLQLISAESSPCPDLFNYNGKEGIITLYNHKHSTIKLNLEFSLRALLTTVGIVSQRVSLTFSNVNVINFKNFSSRFFSVLNVV